MIGSAAGMLTAIIVAGGSSRRMGFDKTFASLGDKPVVAHSIAAFEATKCVDEIIIVGRPDRLSDLEKLCRQYAFGKVRSVIAGGRHRQDSVAQGLRELGAEARYVAVHDAARPLVRPEQIARVFEAGRREGAASLASPVSDTLKRADADNFVAESIPRERVFAMETPQIFERELLRCAYDSVAANQLIITDEASALEHLGEKVILVPNEDYNFKITFLSDLALAELVLQARAHSS